MRYFFKRNAETKQVSYLCTSSFDTYETDDECIEIEKSEIDSKYIDHIANIETCYFDENNEIQIDTVKVLSKKLQYIQNEINDEVYNLRKIIREAATLDKPEVAREVSSIIKTLTSFIDNSDFSNLKTVKDINDIIVPELSINYEEYFFEKLYIL